MEVHSCTILHYGASYLAYALKSVYDQVNRLHVFYNPTPSHGTQTKLTCPDSRDDLLLAAFAYDPDEKIRWYETDHRQEGPQRDAALEVCRQAGAELVLVVDCDEVWSPSTLQLCLAHAYYGRGPSGPSRNWLLNFTTLWRSFNWVCTDDLWPVRMIDLRQSEKTTAYLPREYGATYHFGYAVRDEVLRYKMAIHGHHAEWRPDWYDTKWNAWPPPDDCHPTNLNFWHPKPFDKENLPQVMRSHPWWGAERIA